MRSAAVLAVVVGCGLLAGVDGFAAPMGGLALRGGRVGAGRCGATGSRGVAMKASESDRTDGATEQEIAEAYTVYNQLQSSMNNGQGQILHRPARLMRWEVTCSFCDGRNLPIHQTLDCSGWSIGHPRCVPRGGRTTATILVQIGGTPKPSQSFGLSGGRRIA